MADFIDNMDEFEHCVYMVSATLNGHMFVKIGMSSNIGQRLIQVCNGVPFDMDSAWLLSTVDRYKAAEIECLLHRLFKPNRTRGEWFRFTSHNNGAVELEAAALALLVDRKITGRLFVDVSAMKQFYVAEVKSLNEKPRKKSLTHGARRKIVLQEKQVAHERVMAQRKRA